MTRGAEAFHRLIEIMERLLGEGGCPWDRKQTFATLRTYIIEEAYELTEAITKEASQDICEESGDLLLQVVFIAALAQRQGLFDINDVISTLCDKLVRRHPHVFGDIHVEGAGEVIANWEQIKLREKAQKAGGHKKNPSRLFSGVPKGLPAIMKAYRIQEKASHVGFDWENGDTGPIIGKIEEEVSEVEEALQDEMDPGRVEEEIGDLVFAIVNLARHVKVNPEAAVERANQKFITRFEEVEKRVGASGRTWKEHSLKELDAYWDEVKKSAAGSEKR
jgi:MazG family protein